MNKVAHGFKIGAGVMTAAMSLSFMGVLPVLALEKDQSAPSKDKENTLLGTYGMASPVRPENRNDAWAGSYVYFGNDEGYPIRFRVLDPDTTDYGSRTMLLDCDECLFKMPFDSDRSNVWENSSLSYYLNNAYVDEDFTYYESRAIAYSVKAGGEAYPEDSFAAFFYGQTVGLNGDYVFVLDAADILNEDYGYSPASGWELYGAKWDLSTWKTFNYETCSANNHRKSVKGSDDQFGSWWIRSAFPQMSNQAGYSDSSIYVGYVDKNSIYVSPALNIKKDSILFSTAVSGKAGEAGAEYKLTVINNDIEVKASETKQAVCEGRTVGINYILSGDDAYKVNKMSVLITDGLYQCGNANNSDILYYGSLSGEYDYTTPYDYEPIVNYGTFDLPSGFDINGWGEDYFVYILAENDNGKYATDMASSPSYVGAPKKMAETGWVSAGNDWYYYDESGNAASGWKKINGSWYFFENDGLMHKGWVEGGNTMYYTLDSGKMATGWQKIGKTYYFADIWYYFGSNGAMRTGWQQISGKWYYFDFDGKMHVGFLEDGGKTYFFDEDEGAMKTGWMGIEGTYIYFDASGAAVKNCWKEINGKWYYFDDSGLMASAEWRGGYWLNADGSWTYPYKASWKHDSTGWWYGDTSGWYAKNSTEKIDGIEYDFDAEGYWIS